MNSLSDRLFLLVIVLTIIGCSQNSENAASADGVDFDLNLKLVLELEELAFPRRPVLTTINTVRAYGESGFIATDYHNMQILQLDRDGNIIRRIGQEGRGPGEFAGLSNVIPLRDRRFGVYDSGNERIIIFDEEGNDVIYIDKHPEDPSLRAKVYPLNNGGYLTPSYRRLYEEYNDCLFVELDPDLRALDPCYGSYDALNESENEFLRQSRQSISFGDIHFVREDRFMFVRRSYDGTHYFYERTADNWVIDTTATGYVQVRASVSNTTPIPLSTSLSMDPSNPQIPDDMPSRPSNYTSRYSREEGEAAVIWHNRSMGYEVYDDRYMLHFTLIDPGGDERIPGVELWTTDGTYLGYQRLDHLEEQYDGLKQGGLRSGLSIRAFNDGRLVMATTQALYIFDVTLVVSDRMAEDTVDR